MVNKKKQVVIAVDGPAASGKGTLARKLAAHYSMEYLDTGKLYRYLAYKMLEKNIAAAEFTQLHHIEIAKKFAESLQPQELDGLDLSSEEIGFAASVISVIPKIRQQLVDFQRKIAASECGAVLDGRDIGTVICPNADYKFFINADIAARAKRRFKELQAAGNQVIYERVLQDLSERDARDKTRKISPLVAAPDAIHIDTTEMDAATVLTKAIEIIG